MDNKNLLSELKIHLLENVSDKDIESLIDSVYVERLSPEYQKLLLNLIKVAREKHVETTKFDHIYKQLLYLFVLNGGRRNALIEVARGVHGLNTGRSTLTFISGKSGIGKTALSTSVQMLIEKTAAVFIIARCSEQETGSYSFWRDVVRSVALATDASTDSLPAPIGNASSANSLQQLVNNLADWMSEQSSQKPLVILLDDLHWADADSLDILDILTSRELESPIMFIVTYRSEERHLGHALYDYLPRLQRNRPVSTIHLAPFDVEDVKRLISAYLGKCSDGLVQYLHDRSEGHPFFAIEMLNHLIEQELLLQDVHGNWLPPGDDVDVPNILRLLILQRVERLGSLVKNMLVIAAAVGETWSLKVVEQLVDHSEDALIDSLELALDTDLIQVENDREEIYRFSHGLIKQVLYEDMVARRRKRLHERIARQIEQIKPDDIYALAHHYDEAGDWEKAANYLIEVGQDARERFALHSALEAYSRALVNVQAQKSSDVSAQALILNTMGRTYRLMGRNHDAELMYSRMLELASTYDDFEVMATAHFRLAEVRTSQYLFDFALQNAQEALQIATNIGKKTLQTQAHASLGKLHLLRGDIETSDYHYNEVLNIPETAEQPEVLSITFRQRAYVALWQGRYENAKSLAEKCFHAAFNSNVVLEVTRAHQILSYVQIEMGDYQEAFNNIRKILDDKRIGESYHHQVPRLMNQLGYFYLELGDVENALEWDMEALEISSNQQGVTNYEMQRYCALNVATDYLHLGKLEDAIDYVTRFEQITEASDFVRYRYYSRYLLLMSELYLARGELEETIEFAQEAHTMAREHKIPKNIAKSLWFEALALRAMKKFDKAIENLKKAITIVDDLEHGSLRWRMRLSLASTHLQSGKAADEIIAEARQLAEATRKNLKNPDLLASFQKSKWIAELDALEQNKIPQKASYPAGLTGREVEVLRLVASGMTNQQVAEALHISPRTVNTHMTNILNKTNCDNRTAATAFAIQHHLVSA